MKKHLHTVLNYFGYFSYAPSLDEIFTFFPCKISKKSLQVLLAEEVKAKIIVRLPSSLSHQPTIHYSLATNHSLDTLPQYSTLGEENIVTAVQRYIQVLKIIPFVRFVGVTGASAMGGLREDDDFDLCVVVKHNLLWTTRFFVVLLAKLLGIHHKTGVCLNLFFDESDLIIPRKKQNSYIAHELLQMRPIIDKDRTYERFLNENKWVYGYFPNALHVTPAKAGVQPISFNSKKIIINWIPAFAGMTQRIDQFFKSIQLPIIRRNRTAFFITDTQLWLFKDDFEKKLKQRGLVI